MKYNTYDSAVYTIQQYSAKKSVNFPECSANQVDGRGCDDRRTRRNPILEIENGEYF